MTKGSVKTKWSLKHEILTLFYAVKDPRTPWYAKITALSSLIYLISPADILPDIIPIAGYLDDLFVVPFLMNLSVKLLPASIRFDAELRARRRGKRILIWIIVSVLVICVLVYFIVRKTSS